MRASDARAASADANELAHQLRCRRAVRERLRARRGIENRSRGLAAHVREHHADRRRSAHQHAIQRRRVDVRREQHERGELRVVRGNRSPRARRRARGRRARRASCRARIAACAARAAASHSLPFDDANSRSVRPWPGSSGTSTSNPVGAQRPRERRERLRRVAEAVQQHHAHRARRRRERERLRAWDDAVRVRSESRELTSRSTRPRCHRLQTQRARTTPATKPIAERRATSRRAPSHARGKNGHKRNGGGSRQAANPRSRIPPTRTQFAFMDVGPGARPQRSTGALHLSPQALCNSRASAHQMRPPIGRSCADSRNDVKSLHTLRARECGRRHTSQLPRPRHRRAHRFAVLHARDRQHGRARTAQRRADRPRFHGGRRNRIVIHAPAAGDAERAARRPAPPRASPRPPSRVLAPAPRLSPPPAPPSRAARHSAAPRVHAASPARTPEPRTRTRATDAPRAARRSPSRRG